MTAAVQLHFDVSDFLSRYCDAIDSGDLEAWPSYFTDDALYEIVSKENVDAGSAIPLLRCKGGAMLRDRVLSLLHANVYERPTYRHFLSSLRVSSLGEGAAKAVSNFLVLNTTPVGVTSIYLTGALFAELALIDGAWKARKLSVVYDTLKVPTLLSYPI
jgi:anthranilate 1,2-dioxygenase small subunit